MDIIEAKCEYTRQLINILQNSVYESFVECYKTSKNNLIQFQKELQKIPQWNTHTIKTNTSSILGQYEHWFSELLGAIIVSHVKILSSVRKGNRKIRITIPTNEDFIHTLFIDFAQFLYENPRLFKIDEKGYSKMDVMVHFEKVVDNVIMKFLPFKDILETSFRFYDGDDDFEKTAAYPSTDAPKNEEIQDVFDGTDSEYEDEDEVKEVQLA